MYRSLFSDVINQTSRVGSTCEGGDIGRWARGGGGGVGGGTSGVWDCELRQEADWRALGGWRPRHVERGAVRARSRKRWRSPGADSSAKVALGES
jgi:hypothetical protein